MKLLRTKQCAKCPWKKSTNPHDIPEGYCEIKHANLAETIAAPGIPDFSRILRIMACHHSVPGKWQHCVGWLYNQLGVGNNIPLRLQMRNYENLKDLKIVGPQHDRFQDTLPK